LREILGDIPKNYVSKEFFTGGTVGLVSYDYNRYLEKIENKTIDDLELPELYFVVPKLIIIKNEETKELFEIDFDEKNYIWDLDLEFSEPIIENREISWDDLNRFETNISKEKFMDIVEKAKFYVKEGDIFQVNLSQRFGAEIRKDESIELYRILRAINPSPFASLVHINDFKLISQSPERLVRLKDGIADTRPIAGTRRLVKGNEVKK